MATSRIKNVYLSTIALLKNIKGSDGSSLFKYFNIWDDQIDEAVQAKNHQFKSPAVFVEFLIGQPKQLGVGFVSYPDSSINIHIYHTFLNSRGNMERNEEIFDLRDSVVVGLSTDIGSGNGVDFCSKLMQSNDIQSFKHDNVYHYIVSFKTNFIDSKSSFMDVDSGNGFAVLDNPTLSLNVFQIWFSGVEYKCVKDGINNTGDIVFSNIVSNDGIIYYCTQTNSDIEFNEDKWLIVEHWISHGTYVIGNVILIDNKLYRCIVDNDNEIFTKSNWFLIQN